MSDRTLAQAEMFGNRLRKNARHRRKWARRNGISCYRLYDRDIPELPLVVDWYEGRLHVAEYARPHERDAGEHVAWLDAVVGRAAEVLEVPAEGVFLKQRDRQRGTSQYTRVAESGARFVVSEADLKFRVNLSDYLDTGLFLDHRQTRRMVAEASAGRRMLNLFAYTGSFSVHAAAAGAASTTTVDLSRTYLEWANDNLGLNGLSGGHNRLIQGDVRAWLDEAAEQGWQYDEVVCDPPTFSNSKRMQGTWDVNRDHVDLLQAVRRVTAPGGHIWFSTNARRFRLEYAAPGVRIDDITAQTVPPDFASKRPHRCWRLDISS